MNSRTDGNTRTMFDDLQMDVAPEDRRFFKLWLETCEYASEHKKFGQSVTWNLRHIERGKAVVREVGHYMDVKGRRVLDVGCGSGGILIAFAQAGAHCHGVEPGAHRYEWAKVRTQDHGVAADIRMCTLETAGFPDQSFDVIVATDVLEHVDDYRAVTKEICRLLAPGGIFFATVPNCFHWRNIVSENHTGLFGLLLLPMKWREFYVVRIRRYAHSYPVSYFPPCHKLAEICRTSGVATEEPYSISKILQPGSISNRWKRTLLMPRVIRYLALRFVSWFALPQTYTFIARKTGQPTK
jgi:2-polyprenyl-3-methyl-5-hydroxy-6-metoxy-1,4-benzoquinol methylase